MNGIDDIFGSVLRKGPDRRFEEFPVETGSSDQPSVEVGEVRSTEPMTKLAAYVMDTFRKNVAYRKSTRVEEKLKTALLYHVCEYRGDAVEKLKASGLPTDLFSSVTSTKNRAAKALLVDICNSTDDQPWRIEPSADPEIADEVEREVMAEAAVEIENVFKSLDQVGVQNLSEADMQILDIAIQKMISGKTGEVFNRKSAIARNRAKGMEKKVKDIMDEGKWVDVFGDFIDNLCIFGTGIIVGPIERNDPKNQFKRTKDGGVKFDRKNRRIPIYESISPLDCYPAPNSVEVDDGPLCIRVQYTSDVLWRFSETADSFYTKNGNGWIKETVDDLLDRYPSGGVHLTEEGYDPERRDAENKGVEDPDDCTMEGVRCFASVRGSDLIDFGIFKNIDGKLLKPRGYYRAEVIVIAGYVVYCRIIDDRFGVPIAKGKFYELPGSWWGESIADKLHVVQRTQNNVIKSLFQNMAACSGPIFWVGDVTRLADKSSNALKLHALKTIPFKPGLAGSQGAPMGVIDVPSKANELLAIWDKMRTEADDASGIPAYTYGQSSGQGALRTAAGLAMFSEAASRGMKMVITTLDRLVIRKVVKMTADWVLLNDQDMSIKGDVEVVPAGIMGKVMKAQQDQQRLQLLQMITNNQFLSGLVGPKGIMALLRPSIQDVAINPDDVLPSEEKIEEMELLQKMQQLFQATAQAGAAQQGMAEVQKPQQQGGGVPGVQRPPEVQGGVAERQSVA